MAQLEKFVKKLYTAFKLSGFLVRREFCVYIIEKFSQEDVDLNCSDNFDIYFKRLCDTLEKQCLLNKSIEKNNIEQAVEVCLHSGRDKSETIFNVIDAFDFPRLQYNPDRKMYFFSTSQSRLLSDANSKTQLFWDRYTTILQRTLRNFRNLQLDNEKDRPSLQTVDYLLTSNNITLHTTLVLGSLLQVSEGKYYLEDPTGIVQLDLSHAKYRGRFFLENTFVLVNGYYEDKILLVSTVVVPPGEKYADSKVVFNNINYFGGPSSTLLRDSKNLKDQLVKHALDTMFFFSDVWLDHPMMFEKLEILFEGLQNSPPIAFVFMGNFMEELNGLDKMNVLKKLFKQFGELLGQFPNLVNNSNFVFVPSMSDPSTPHLVPRMWEGYVNRTPVAACLNSGICRLQRVLDYNAIDTIQHQNRWMAVEEEERLGKRVNMFEKGYWLCESFLKAETHGLEVLCAELVKAGLRVYMMDEIGEFLPEAILKKYFSTEELEKSEK